MQVPSPSGGGCASPIWVGGWALLACRSGPSAGPQSWRWRIRPRGVRAPRECCSFALVLRLSLHSLIRFLIVRTFWCAPGVVSGLLCQSRCVFRGVSLPYLVTLVPRAAVAQVDADPSVLASWWLALAVVLVADMSLCVV